MVDKMFNSYNSDFEKSYEKNKNLVLRIFSLIKEDEQNNLKEEFYDSYIDFSRKLDDEGYYDESNSYMSICEMYYRLIDRPEVLVAHESFFMDLFKAFEEFLYVKINNPEEFQEKCEEFLFYKGKMQEYYYTKVAIPSPHYDEDVLNEITRHLIGGLY